MSSMQALTLVLSLLVLPLAFTAVDGVGGVRARHATYTALATEADDDFEVLVPIYGAIRYLENVAYLRDYGSKVLLCTTTAETPDFDRELDRIASDNGFRVFRGEVAASNRSSGQRSTSGTVRDRLVRDALALVRASYVVCVDADTTTVRPLGELVRSMRLQGLDMVSIRLVPANGGSPLARLQGHEYRLAMRMRLVVPWLVSGACHAARTEVHREVMNRHSLFFQGNDVETGALADALGYRVGHLAFEVPTTVPERPKAWFRQRLAWAGGEFRLFVVNFPLIRKHPFFWIYGAVIVIAAVALRWKTVLDPGYALAATVAAYIGLTWYLHWPNRDRWLIVLPFYCGFSSLVLTPLGVGWYFWMAWTSRNVGLIRPRRPVAGQRPRGAHRARASSEGTSSETTPAYDR